MKDEGDQQLRLTSQCHQGIPDLLAQFRDVAGCQVTQPVILGPAPDTLIGVGVRGVRREVLHYHFGMDSQPRFHHPRLAVNLVAVPHNRPRAAHFTLELPQEQHHLLAVEVLVVAQQHEVQSHTQRPRTEGDRTNHADAVVFVRAVQDGRLATRSQGTSDHGGQQKARFVQQSKASLTLERLADDAGPVVGYPAFHLLEVLFAGAFLRLLRGPVQTLIEQPADVIGMVINAEVALDQYGDPLGGPQVVGPTVRHSPLVEQALQSNQLLRAETRRAARGGLDSQSVGLASQASPTTQGGTSNAKDACDDAGRLSTFDQCDGPTPASFQLSSCPFWSHTTLYASPCCWRSFPAPSSVTP